MEKVRIGNDIQVKYTVLRDGLPESFAGATNIVVEVRNEAYGKVIPSTFSIVDNVVNVVLDAKDCVLCGKHRVTLSYNRGNDITIDALAFELVQFTSQTGGTEIVGVEIVTVNISGDIGIAIPDNNKIDLDGLNSNIDKLHFKPDTLVQLSEIGDVRYSQESKTLEVKVSDTVSIQLGQEMQTRVKNDAGVQINNGQLVYINSAAGANPLAKIASTTDANIAQRTFGMATENIANNGFGAITTEGLVRDVNTAAFTEGDMLWLGINGAVTNIEPVAPTPKISVGMVLRSNVNSGVIYVKIRAIARNQKLSDVYAPTLAGGDILRWNSTTLRFETFNITTALAGKADLVGGKIPTSQLPSYVDDVLEYTNLAAFPATGETGKIYVALDTNLTYRWSGSAYIEISKSLALGETSATAYRGDRGKTAYDHSQLTNSNPHGTTASKIPNTPAGTIAATTVQAAINELDADRVQLETDLNEKIYGDDVKIESSEYSVIGYPAWATGIITSSNSYRNSGYIELEKGDKIDFTTTSGSATCDFAYYDENKVYNQGKSLRGSNVVRSGSYTATEKCYVIITVLFNQISSNLYYVYTYTLSKEVKRIKTEVGIVENQIQSINNDIVGIDSDMDVITRKLNEISNVDEYDSIALVNEGSAIVSTTGATAVFGQSNYNSTNKIRVYAGLKVKVILPISLTSDRGLVFYDENGTYISGFRIASSTIDPNLELTVPDNGYWVATTYYNDEYVAANNIAPFYLKIETSNKEGRIEKIENSVIEISQKIDASKVQLIDIDDVISNSNIRANIVDGTNGYTEYEVTNSFDITLTISYPFDYPLKLALFCKKITDNEVSIYPRYDVSAKFYQTRVIDNMEYKFVEIILPPNISKKTTIIITLSAGLVFRTINLQRVDLSPVTTKGGILMTAHLGIAYGYNTLMSYQTAAKLGFPVCIANLRDTSDGILVCAHDDEFIGNDGNTYYLSQTTYEDVNIIGYRAAINVNNRYYIRAGDTRVVPTTYDFLSICAKTGMRPFLSCHSDTLDWDILKGLLRGFGFLKNGLCTIKAQTSSRLIAAYNSLGDNCRYMLNVGGIIESSVDQFAGLNLGNAVKVLECSDVDVTKEQVEYALSKGMIVSLYDVYEKNTAYYSRWISYGITEFTTDNMLSCSVNW